MVRINRLSDHLFVPARLLNASGDEILWVPGADRGRIRAADRPFSEGGTMLHKPA